eukprot:m.921 g.921  ORF g.921 m.921 type:complete len:272 (+) comp5159_c0_seq2:450-1265(+)
MDSILSSPLNQAHKVERDAERLKEKRMYGKAAALYGEAAKLIEIAANENQDQTFDVTQSLQLQFNHLKQAESRLLLSEKQEQRRSDLMEHQRAVERLKKAEKQENSKELLQQIKLDPDKCTDGLDPDTSTHPKKLRDDLDCHYLDFLRTKRQESSPMASVSDGHWSLSKQELLEKLDWKDTQLRDLEKEFKKLKQELQSSKKQLQRALDERDTVQDDFRKFRLKCVCGLGEGRGQGATMTAPGNLNECNDPMDMSPLDSLSPLAMPPSVKF